MAGKYVHLRGAWSVRGDFVPAGESIAFTGVSVHGGDLVIIAVRLSDDTAPASAAFPDWMDAEASDWVNGNRMAFGVGRAPSAFSSLTVAVSGGGGNIAIVTGGMAAFSGVQTWDNRGVLRLGPPYPEISATADGYILVGACVEGFVDNFSPFSSADDFVSFGLTHAPKFGVRGPIIGPSGPLSGADGLSGSFSFMAVVVVPDLPPIERIRSSVSEDAGSLFQATQAAAVELGLSEAFEYGAEIPAGRLRSFREALTPDETAVSYYPLPTRNQEMLVTVEGETNLGRMASTYPSRIMRRGSDIPGNVGGEITPQQAIQFIFDQWASEFPWFSAEAVPDLRLMVRGALTGPRQYYLDYPTAGILRHGAVTIPQEVHPDGRDERQTMREILDEWTGIFPGTVPRQTSRGTIELVPRVGPDAPDTPLLLTWQDLKGISDGEDDPRGVINRARVVVQGWRFEDEQGITAPAFLAIGGMPDAAWPDPPDPNALPDDRERLTDGATQRFALLTAGDSILVSWAATEATVEQSGGSWAHFSIRGSDSGDVTLTRSQPTQTVTVNATLYWGVANLNSLHYSTIWRFTWDGDVGVSVVASTIGSAYTERIAGSTGRTWYLGHLLEFAAFGTAWVRSKESVVGEFGLPGQTLPGPDGTNALTESRALYGERQATINSTQFQLTPEQARQVAEAHVLFNINPRTVRDVQQSEWDLYPIKFDDIGRLVDLPTGERAVVENRSYSDSFSATTGAMQSAFTAAVTEVVIDTATDWLLLDNGDWFQLDTGEMVEAS